MLSGLLGALGYAGFGHFYLGWIFLVPALWAIHDVSPRRAFFLGWVGGSVGNGLGLYPMIAWCTYRPPVRIIRRILRT